MNRKQLFIILTIGFLALLAIVFLVRKSKPKHKSADLPPARKVAQINQLPIEDRPFVTLTPRHDGREVTLTIDNIGSATEAEYELEYQTDSLIQGVFGTLDFSQETMPVVKKLLFGSCSKGKCRYDQGVTGGNLILTFSGQDQPYTLKTDFNLQLSGSKKGVFTSKDIKASLDSNNNLAATTYVTVAQTMGLPAPVKGQVLAGPYAFLAATSPVLKQATITIQSKEDLSTAKLLFWDGSQWLELSSQVDSGKITAPVTSLGTFVLVK